MSEETTEKTKKPMNKKVKKALLQSGGFLASIAPILVVIGLNWSDYTSSTPSIISLSVGGAMALVLMLLKAIGKMPKDMKSVFKYAIAFVLVFLLDPLIQDLKWLLGAALIGEVLDISIFEWMINRTQKEIDAEINANGMQEQTNQLVDAIKGLKEEVEKDSSGRT